MLPEQGTLGDVRAMCVMLPSRGLFVTVVASVPTCPVTLTVSRSPRTCMRCLFLVCLKAAPTS